MEYRQIALAMPLLLAACAAESPYNPLADYEELDATTILEAPSPIPGNFAPQNRYQVERGKYLVELLGCGACHTDGALDGAPNKERALAGSRIGIAYLNPLGDKYPGIIYPPNITPDIETIRVFWCLPQSLGEYPVALRSQDLHHNARSAEMLSQSGFHVVHLWPPSRVYTLEESSASSNTP